MAKGKKYPEKIPGGPRGYSTNSRLPGAVDSSHGRHLPHESKPLDPSVLRWRRSAEPLPLPNSYCTGGREPGWKRKVPIPTRVSIALFGAFHAFLDTETEEDAPDENAGQDR